MSPLPPILAFLAILVLSYAAPAYAAPDDVRYDTPSGYPVPRIVSLKSSKTYCRTGPSFDHPVKITFQRQGLPVVIIAETVDHWRKIKDHDGDQCWTHKSKLSGAKTVLVTSEGVILRKKPFSNAPTAALLGTGVVAKVLEDRNGWLLVAANGNKGWAGRAEFWGASPGDSFAAPHN